MMMKFVFSTLLILLNSSVTSAQEPAACLTEVDPDTDYFPIKVSPGDSLSWGIEYFNTYKIVTNIVESESYLLYQCGSEPPQDAIDSGLYNAVIQIPVSSVGVDETPTIPFLEHLGVVESIAAFTSNPGDISSPCLLESISNGEVIVLQSKEAFNDFEVAPDSTADTLKKLEGAVGFIKPFNTDPPFSSNVKVSEYTEKSNAAIFEWIKFYSVFFNLEEKANEVFSAAEERWECVSDDASRAQTDSPDKPTVLWAYYSDYCRGWDVGECPNYYCEYAQQCSANLLTSPKEEIDEVCFAVYLTTEELVELGKGADHWIYPAGNWDEAYAMFKDTLDTMKSVQNMQVFDYQASGPNAWFEQRFPEYFAVLQDFCSIVGTTAVLTGKSWFRNVMDGSPIGGLGECTESSRANSLLSPVGAQCEAAPDPVITPTTTSGASAVAVGASALFVLAAVYFA